MFSACIYFEVALYLTEMYPICRRWSGDIGNGALNEGEHSFSLNKTCNLEAFPVIASSSCLGHVAQCLT